MVDGLAREQSIGVRRSGFGVRQGLGAPPAIGSECRPVCRPGATAISVCTMGGARALTMKMATEGFWSLLRSWLRPHRGISQEKLPLYLGFFAFVHNVSKRGKALLGVLMELLLT